VLTDVYHWLLANDLAEVVSGLFGGLSGALLLFGLAEYRRSRSLKVWLDRPCGRRFHFPDEKKGRKPGC
jgi:hypothetical protein